MRLKDRVALVTGAGAGIGEAIALKFAREGAKVVVNDLNPETGQATVDKIKNNSGMAAFIQGDTTQAAVAEKMVKFAVDTYGSLDVLVNNAGIEIVKSVLETTEEDWDRIMAVNLKGFFLVAKQAGLQMLKQGGGSIVNLSSVAGLVGFPLLGAYCATKHGVIGLTKTMAIELREQNIRINAICPAFIETSMVDRAIDVYAKAGVNVPERAEQMQGRLGKPEEVAEAALYLASDESSFINGIALALDNGLTAS